jgi:hypothetical protein
MAKLIVVGAAIATSIFVLGAGICLCAKHEISQPNKLFARSHDHRTSTKSTYALSATLSAATAIIISIGFSTMVYADLVATITVTAASSVIVVATAPSSSKYSSAPAASTPANSSKPAIASTTAVAPAGGNFWQPPVKSSWQIILNHVLDVNALSTSVAPDVDVFDIDLFDNPKETFDALKRLGKKSICYFSAGSYEPNRPDSGDFLADDKGLELDGWPGEFWLKLDNTNVRQIMTKRIELAAAKGCDAIDPVSLSTILINLTQMLIDRRITSTHMKTPMASV